MKLVIRTDVRNIIHLIKKNKLHIEGSTDKMCMVIGTKDNIRDIKYDLNSAENSKYEYFDYK